MQENAHKVTIRIVKTKRLTTSFYKLCDFSAFLYPGLSKYCCFHVVVFCFLFFLLFFFFLFFFFFFFFCFVLFWSLLL